VEEEGVRRWLHAQRRDGDLAAFDAGQARKRELAAAVEAMRTRLDAVYRSEAPAEEKKRAKSEEFARLRAQFGNFVPAEPNNAFLVSISVYTQLVPGFERLLAQSGGNLPSFYKRVRNLANEDKSARELALR